MQEAKDSISQTFVLDVPRVTLGQGSFFNAYKGTFRGRDVAIKMARDVGHELGFLYRAENNQKTIKHPYVLEWLAGHFNAEMPNRTYIVLEYANFGTLDDFINRCCVFLPWTAFAYFFYRINQGLAHIHAHGILHRDIKPENILLSFEDQCLIPKIADFGFSTRGTWFKLSNEHGASSDSLRIIDKGMLGSPFYMAPEIFLHHEYSDKSDNYALIVSMFKYLMLRVPFHQISTIEKLMLTVVKQGLRATLSRELHSLQALFDIGWAGDPRMRANSQTIDSYLQQYPEPCLKESYFRQVIAPILRRHSPLWRQCEQKEQREFIVISKEDVPAVQAEIYDNILVTEEDSDQQRPASDREQHVLAVSGRLPGFFVAKSVKRSTDETENSFEMVENPASLERGWLNIDLTSLTV